MQQRLPQFPAEPAFGFRVQRTRCLFANRNFAASRSLSFGHVAGVGEGSGLCAVRKGPCPSSQQTPRAVLGETRREEVFAATEGPRGLMPARALGCESQEPRPVGVSGAVGTLGVCGSSALMLPPRPWPPPGFEKDDSRKGDRARERNPGRWSRGITVRLETPLVRRKRGAAGPGIPQHRQLC